LALTLHELHPAIEAMRDVGKKKTPSEEAATEDPTSRDRQHWINM